MLRLIASHSRRSERGRTRAGLGALLGYCVVVAGALLGTLRPADPRRVATPVSLTWPQPKDPGVPIRAPVPVGSTPPATAGDGTWRLDLVEEPPFLLAERTPSYPEALRAAGIAGRVVVQAVIDTLGRAEPGVTVVEGSYAAFEAPALDYVRRALFRPGCVHGRPVRVLIRLPVDFRLTDGH